MSNDNGGPAFPDPQENWRGDKGMTLRDYFAAKAMAALIAEPAWMEGSRPIVAIFDDRDKKTDGPQQFAHVAYRMADAMLEERQQ